MHDAVRSLLHAELVASTARLRSAGLEERPLAVAVRRGELVWLRRDRYCLPDLDERFQAAVSLGGLLDCVSELERLGIWVTKKSAGIHIHTAPNGSRLPVSGAEVRHWRSLMERPSSVAVAPIDALDMALSCQPEIDAIATLDSALHQGMIAQSALERLRGGGRLRRVIAQSDGRSESGLESIVRVVLRRLGIRVEPQVVIPAVGRVDLLVGGSVVVETDGAAFHAGARRHSDHQRDASVARIGLTPLRFDAAQVHGEIEEVVLAVVGALRAHRGAGFSGEMARRVRRRVVEMLSS